MLLKDLHEIFRNAPAHIYRSAV